jgi:hypothetical protein
MYRLRVQKAPDLHRFLHSKSVYLQTGGLDDRAGSVAAGFPGRAAPGRNKLTGTALWVAGL